MARAGLCLTLCAVLVGGAWTLVPAAAPEGREAKVATLLAVQKALQEGRDNLQRGNYQAAVFVLESQVARINGSREYLAALRDAYRGYIRELQQSNRTEDLPVYLRRLEILDPGAVLELNAGQNRVASADRPTEASPTEMPPKKVADNPEPKKRPEPEIVFNPPTRSSPEPGAKVAGSTKPSSVKARGQAEDDPFADTNARTDPGAALVQKAEKEFDEHHYGAACRLFEQANRLSPDATAGSKERWAYCKLHGVVDALNSPGSKAGSLGELEAEVRGALAMAKAPELDAFGKDLLGKIKDRQARGVGAAPFEESLVVEVRHAPRQGQGWALAETANFRVFHTQSKELAEKVARIAETTRAAMARKWFGDNGGTWSPRCDVYLHATAQDYSQATGVPANSPGHSTIRNEGGRVLTRRIDLHCDDGNMCVGVLPHETTHVVLAGRFGSKQVPRWADEGMAVLTEPRDLIDRHLNNLSRHKSNRELFPVGQLMQLDDYPDPRYIGSFYAESVSVVDFLSREKGPEIFARFLRDGLEGGYEQALRRHYGFQGFQELEQRWQNHAFSSEARGGAGAAEGSQVAGR